MRLFLTIVGASLIFVSVSFALTAFQTTGGPEEGGPIMTFLLVFLGVLGIIGGVLIIRKVQKI